MICDTLIKQAVSEVLAYYQTRNTKLDDAYLEKQASHMVASMIEMARLSHKRRTESKLPVDGSHKARLLLRLTSADISRGTGQKIVEELLAETVS